MVYTPLAQNFQDPEARSSHMGIIRKVSIIGCLTEKQSLIRSSILAQSVDENTLRFIQLPSVLRGIPESLPWDITVDIEIRDFSMDQAQDLLVLVEVLHPQNPTPTIHHKSCVHLLSLSTGSLHSLATLNPLERSIEHFTPEWSYTIQIRGDYLGILYGTPQDEVVEGIPTLYIWNWLTGDAVVELFSFNMQSFVFLDHRYIAVGAVPIAEAEEPYNNSTPSLRLFRYTDHAGQPLATLTPTRLATLVYPFLVPHAQAYDLTIRADPASAWMPPSSQAAPFHLSATQRIFVIKFLVGDEYHGGQTLHCAPYDVLILHAERGDALAQRCLEPGLTPWIAWGSQGSRLWVDEEEIEEDWVGYVFGPRMITSRMKRTGSGEKRLKVILRDFSNPGVRHGLGIDTLVREHPVELLKAPRGSIFNTEPAGRWKYYSDMQVSMAGGEIELFKEPVLTSRPYREVSRVLPKEIYNGGSAAVMLSEDTLIIVDTKVSLGSLF
jgi:hypothetical protein